MGYGVSVDVQPAGSREVLAGFQIRWARLTGVGKAMKSSFCVIETGIFAVPKDRQLASLHCL